LPKVSHANETGRNLTNEKSSTSYVVLETMEFKQEQATCINCLECLSTAGCQKFNSSGLIRDK